MELIRNFSIGPGSHTDWQNPAEFSPKGRPIRNFPDPPILEGFLFAEPLKSLEKRGKTQKKNKENRKTKKKNKEIKKSKDWRVRVQYRPRIVDTDIDCGRHFCGHHFRDSYEWWCSRSPRPVIHWEDKSRGIKRDKLNGTNGANSQFFSQIFADFCRFLFLVGILQHFGGADFRRKPQIFAENRRKPQIFAENRLSHLVCPL